MISDHEINNYYDCVKTSKQVKISGSYNKDYDIINIDDIIKKKLLDEKGWYIDELKAKKESMIRLVQTPQTYIMREKSLNKIKELDREMAIVGSEKRYEEYMSKTKDLLIIYKKYIRVKTWVFTSNADEDDVTNNMNDEDLKRISIIEKYLDIASAYVEIDVIRINDAPTNVCIGCGFSLTNVVPSADGTILCPVESCYTEHAHISLTKTSKDNNRTNNASADDESIENFLRAFIRYQGWQTDRIDQQVYLKLDEYFNKSNRPSRSDILALPLNNRRRKGDTDHRMLYNALSNIGCTEYYEDCNLIGNVYWGWILPNVMQYKNTIIDHYNKTQKVFYLIPIEQRERISSLGTQYRLWRHLQLVGCECYIDEFRIAENPESLRIHNTLWQMMCEGTDDPNIRYIQ